MYNTDTFSELTGKLQSKVNEMTGEMNDKNDDLDAHFEEVNQAQGTFEEIEQEIQDLLDAINDMAEFEGRIEDAINEADNLIN